MQVSLLCRYHVATTSLLPMVGWAGLAGLGSLAPRFCLECAWPLCHCMLLRKVPLTANDCKLNTHGLLALKPLSVV